IYRACAVASPVMKHATRYHDCLYQCLKYPFCFTLTKLLLFGIICGLVDRALLLSHSNFHVKNISFIINILINNDYSLKFIFDIDTINKKIKDIVQEKFKTNEISINNEESSQVTSWFTVPFVPTMMDKFKQFNRNNIKVSYFSTNKLRKYIKVHKDPLDSFSKSNVVYKI
ncbi:hypothetical protein ALC62_10317, partial [Cyphomyrmex costatus]